METITENQQNPTGYLLQESGNEKGRVHALSGFKVFVGRNRNADIKLFTPAVSRNHCTLKYDNETWFIMDNSSFNGIYINNKKVAPNAFHPLKDGQKIYFGPPENSQPEPHCFTFLSHLNTDLQDKNIDIKEIEEKSQRTEVQSCIQNVTPRKTVLVYCSPEKSGKKRKIEEDTTLTSRTTDSDSDSITCKRKKTSPIELSNSQPSNSQNEHVFIAGLNTPDFSSPSLKDRLALIKQRLEESDKIQERVQQTLRDSEACLKQSWKRNINQCLRFDEEKKEEEENDVEDSDSQSLLTKVDEYYLESEPYPFSQPLLDDIRFCSQDSTLSTIHNWETSQNHETEVRTESQERLASVEKSIEHDGLREKLEKALMEKNELLEKHETIKKEEEKLRKELEHAKNNQQTLKSEVMTQFGDIMEVEFTCGICTELFIKAVTLECSHTFCEKCISEWKKKKKQCPICRARITGETRALVIDNFIDKMVAKLSPDYQERRRIVVEDRLKDPVVPKPAQRGRQGRARGRGRHFGSISPTSILTDSSVVMLPEDSDDSIDFPAFVGEAETWRAVLGALTERDSDSESSLEGFGFYGGYGRCFNCGRRGHWANGCPDP